MPEPAWVEIEIVLDIHEEQLALFGGPGGIRDTGLLESALARAHNLFAYGESDPAKLAAAYAFGIARNHPFVDGNKRTSLATLLVFLGLNDIAFAPPPAETTAIMLGLAAGEIGEEELANWIRDHLPEGG
jgi:death-on-curing protein